jgi:hypothetical protein
MTTKPIAAPLAADANQRMANSRLPNRLGTRPLLLLSRVRLEVSASGDDRASCNRIRHQRHRLNAKSIGLLPHGVVVVNTARGGLVVDEDLIAAFRSGQMAAAGLDVFEGEPHIHPGYLELKNTFLLPHVGSATVETRVAMGMLALDNIDSVLAGRPAATIIPG